MPPCSSNPSMQSLQKAPNVLGHQNNNPPHPGCDNLSRIQVFLGWETCTSWNLWRVEPSVPVNTVFTTVNQPSLTPPGNDFRREINTTCVCFTCSAQQGSFLKCNSYIQGEEFSSSVILSAKESTTNNNVLVEYTGTCKTKHQFTMCPKSWKLSLWKLPPIPQISIPL